MGFLINFVTIRSVISFLAFIKNHRLLISFILVIFWQSYIFNLIYPIHYNFRNIFFSDLVNHPITISLWFGYLFGFMDMLLLYMIGKKIFHSGYAFIPALIFGISPWTAYLLAADSVYPFIVCWILLIGYGFLLLNLSKQIFGKVLIILGLVTCCYSSLYLIIVIPFFFIGAILLKIFSFNQIKPIIFTVTILLIPLGIFMVVNFEGVKNIFAQQVTIFTDPGVINSNNMFQGQAQKSGVGLFSKIAENKYEHFSRYSVLKILSNLTPSVYFTPQEKLLSFSFSPPIYLGFIIPFLYGLYQMLCSTVLRKYLVFSLILIIPSVITKQQVDLNHLFIFIPVIILVISYGLINLYQKKRQGLFRIILYFIFGMIFFQMALTVFDVSTLEYQRYLKYYNNTYSFELGRQ